MGCTSLSVLDGATSSESQTGKQHLSFVNKGKTILHFTSWYLFSQGVITKVKQFSHHALQKFHFVVPGHFCSLVVVF